jgi:plastocyanin
MTGNKCGHGSDGVVVLGFLVGGCSAAGSSSVGGGRWVAVTDLADTVVIKDFAFGPTSLVVAPETKITVVKQDRAPHTVTTGTTPSTTALSPVGSAPKLLRPARRAHTPTSALSTCP